MTNRKAGRIIVYRCDYPGCRATHKAPTTNFAQAWPHAKAAGWMCAKLGDRWFHFCDWVHRPANDRQLQEIADGKMPGLVRYG